MRTSVIQLACLLLLATGCGSLRNAAVNQAAGVFSGESAVFAFQSESDPELVRDALPFAIKASEIFALENPHSPELNLAAGRLCIQYANAFLDQPADYIQDKDYPASKVLRFRAGQLYTKGRDYVMTGLRARHKGAAMDLTLDWGHWLPRMTPADVPYLYWLAAGWGGAIKSDSSNLSRVAELPAVTEIARTALALDAAYDDGAIPLLMISLDHAQGSTLGLDPDRLRGHFDEAVRLGEGQSAAPYVALAESLCVAQQDLAEFVRLLDLALAIDPDRRPAWRLANVLAQRRARWLMSMRADLFVDYEEPTP